jgi:hypothetical protein
VAEDAREGIVLPAQGDNCRRSRSTTQCHNTLVGLGNLEKKFFLVALLVLGAAAYLWVYFIRMVASGEQSGDIDSMLEHVAGFLDEETENALGGMTSLIEPLLIVFLGVVIGDMVICVFLPIFKLPELVNGGH